MFNTTNQKININAVSGTIAKNYKDSFFKRFHLNSSFAGYVLCEHSDYVVLQMMMCGDMEVLAELMTKSDFNKLFNEEESNGI